MVKRTTTAKRVVTTMFSAFLQREGIWRWRNTKLQVGKLCKKTFITTLQSTARHLLLKMHIRTHMRTLSLLFSVKVAESTQVSCTCQVRQRVRPLASGGPLKALTERACDSSLGDPSTISCFVFPVKPSAEDTPPSLVTDIMETQEEK